MNMSYLYFSAFIFYAPWYLVTLNHQPPVGAMHRGAADRPLHHERLVGALRGDGLADQGSGSLDPGPAKISRPSRFIMLKSSEIDGSYF